MNSNARILPLAIVTLMMLTPVGAQDTDPLAAALEQKVTLQFLETPLSAVLAFLQDTFAVPVVLDPNAGEEAVTIQLKDTSLGNALDLVLEQVDMAYVREDGVLFISNRDAIEGRRATVRTFVVDDLLSPVHDFPPRHASSFRLDGHDDDGAMGISMSDDEGLDMLDMDMLMELIEERVQPESWDRDYASMQEVAGLLVTRQTPEIHDEIAALLDKLRAGAGLLVSTEARYYAVPRSELAAITGGKQLLDAAARLRLEKTGRLLHEVSITGFNSQRISAHSGGALEFVKDYDVEVAQSAFCFDPIVATLHTGMMLDVRAVLGPENSFASLDLRVNITALDKPSELSDICHGASAGTASGSGVSGFALTGMAAMGIGSPAQNPSIQVDELQTYTRIPLGMGRVFLRTSTLVAPDEVAVLIITTNLSE